MPTTASIKRWRAVRSVRRGNRKAPVLYGIRLAQKSRTYPSYLLTNNNANIRRTRQRIEDLKSQSEYAGWAFPGGRAEINEGENRLQLFFEEKPSEEQRRELKSNGFKWAPSQGAWQRQLTKNAIYAAGRMEFLRPEDGQSPYQLQPFARKTEKDMTR